MANENDLIQNVVIQTDEAKAKKTIESLLNLQKAQERVTKQIQSGKKSYVEGAKELQKWRKRHDELSSSLTDSQRDFLKENNLLKDYEKAVERATRANTGLARSFGEIADSRRSAIDVRGAGLAGDVASSVAGVRGGLSAVGVEAAGGILEVTEAFADFGEFVPQLIGQVDSLGKGIQIASATSKGFTGTIATMTSGIGATIAPMLGVSAATATLLVAALPVAAAVGAAALAVQNYNKQAEAQRQVLSATIDAQRSVNEAVAEGMSTEEAEARLEELRRLREGEAGTLGNLEDAYQSMEDQLGILSGAIKVFDGREQELADSIQESQATVQGYDAEIRALERSLADGSLAANDAAVSETELIGIREQAAKQIESDISQAESRAAQALSKSAQISAQITDAYTQRDLAQANALELQEVQAKHAEQDRQAAAKDHQDKLRTIQADGNKRIQSLQDGFTELATERASALQDADDKGNEKLQALRSDFFKKQVSATEKYARETEQIEGQRAKEIKRITEDTLKSQRKAVLANDVSAFIEATESGNEALAKAQEEASESEKQRAQELIQQREQERQAFVERQAQIIQGIQDEKSNIIEAFNERRAALQEQIATERAAIQERLQAEKEAEQQRLANLQQRAEREAELQAVREQQEQDAFNRRIAALRDEQRAAQDAHSREMSNIQQLQSLKQQTYQAEVSALQQIAAQARAIAQSAASGGGRGSFGGRGGGSRFGYGGSAFSRRQTSVDANRKFGSSGGGGRRFTAFHDGGRTVLPTGATEGLALVKANEMIFPDGKSYPMAGREPLETALARSNMGRGTGGNNITLAPTYNMTVGDIASTSAVSQALEGNNRLLMEELNKLIGDLTA